MAKPLRDISPKKPKEGEFSGKRSSTIEAPAIDGSNLYQWNSKDGVDFIKKHKTEKHDYPYDADAAFTGKPEHYVLNSKKEKRHGNMIGQAEKVYEEEQIDEVLDTSMKKLAYTMKAYKQIKNADPIKMANDPDAMRQVVNRTTGVARVNKKLTKESKSMKCEACGNMYEGDSCGCGGSAEDKKGKKLLLGGKKLQEVLTKKTSAGKVISDFVHSDNPKFAGKSKEERKRMALGAYYGMHPEKSKKMEEEVDLEEKTKSKERKESAAADTEIQFPSDKIGDIGRV